MRPHGRSRYLHGPDENGQEGKGCRCGKCRNANSRAANEYRLSLLDPNRVRKVNAEPVRAHVATLLRAELSVEAVARLSGVDRQVIRTLLSGDPKTGRAPSRTILSTNASALLAVPLTAAPPVGLVPAAGTQRRLRGLSCMGFPTPVLAAQSDMSPQQVRKLMSAKPGRCVGADTAARVKDMCRRLWHVDPAAVGATSTESLRARNRALAKGWLPLAAWDDDYINLPDAALNTFLQQQVELMEDDELRRCAASRRMGDRSPLTLAASREYDRRRPRKRTAA